MIHRARLLGLSLLLPALFVGCQRAEQPATGAADAATSPLLTNPAAVTTSTGDGLRNRPRPVPVLTGPRCWTTAR